MKPKVTDSTDNKLLCGQRVAECRKRAGYTQEKVIELIMALPENRNKNRTEKQLSYIENGNRSLSIEYAHLLSQVLNVRSAYLLGMDNYKTDDEILKNTMQHASQKDTACQMLLESLGYKFKQVDSSLYQKQAKRITVLSDDTPEQIFQHLETAEPLTLYALKNAKGKTVYIEHGKLLSLINDIEDYANYQCQRYMKNIQKAYRLNGPQNYPISNLGQISDKP